MKKFLTTLALTSIFIAGAFAQHYHERDDRKYVDQHQIVRISVRSADPQLIIRLLGGLPCKFPEMSVVFIYWH